VMDSAQQIWLAGLGAFARAQAEGGKVFDALVKEGASLQKRSNTEQKLGELASKLTGMAGDMQARAGQQWDKLEGVFEARTAKALNRLGVPSAKDLEALNARIDGLEAQLAKLAKLAAAKKPGAARAPATQAVAKRAAARKPAARRAPRA
jgi:poly(hydroxyalkanoate) granule-associated protein